MLDVLIPGLDARLPATCGSRAAEILAEERGRLADPDFLVEHVIKSPAEFAWDFDVLDRGFLALADPYLEAPTGIGGFYLSLLDELGADSAANRHGVLILEFMHLATRINDTFNFADELSRAEPRLRECEPLVQLRYTAQFLNNYPRYTIIENRYETSPENRQRLHRWGTNVFTTVGMSRAAFVTWCHRGFRDVALPHYHQNAINTLCEAILSPVSVAMIVADVDEERVRTVRRAFLWAELAVKLACERRVLEGDAPDPDDEWTAASLMPVRFPGHALIATGASVDDSLEEGGRFPPIRRVVADGLRVAREEVDDRTMSELSSESSRALTRFEEELAPTGMFQETSRRIVAALAAGGAR